MYANGGHNPPILVDSDGATPLETTGGSRSACSTGSTTTTPTWTWSRSTPGLFSDGVTEAFNASEEAFGDDRLLDTTRALPVEQGPDQDVNDIVNAVDEFAGDAPQFDDITCVVLVYKGGASKSPAPLPPRTIPLETEDPDLRSDHAGAHADVDPEERPVGACPARRGDRVARRGPWLAGEVGPEPQTSLSTS